MCIYYNTPSIIIKNIIISAVDLKDVLCMIYTVKEMKQRGMEMAWKLEGFE